MRLEWTETRNAAGSTWNARYRGYNACIFLTERLVHNATISCVNTYGSKLVSIGPMVSDKYDSLHAAQDWCERFLLGEER